MKRFVFIFAFIITFIINGAEITGKVIKVYDGDTIQIMDVDGGKFKIRFAEIDAPESTQSFGRQSKEFLYKFIYNKNVRIKFTSIDMYGRIVGEVHYLYINVNEKMIEEGWAWHYKNYSKNNEKLAVLEKNARLNKRGIWCESNNIPPWIYRKENKKKR